MDRKWLCINCEKPFMSGEWYNCRGNKTKKHVVESKTYYSESDRMQFNAIPQTTMLGAQGERIPIPGKIVEFMGGVYHTQDPEIQELMDPEYPMTKDEYINLRTTEQQKNARLRQKLDEQTALVDELKARNAELEAAAGKKPAPEKAMAAGVEAPQEEGELVGAARAKARRKG